MPVAGRYSGEKKAIAIIGPTPTTARNTNPCTEGSSEPPGTTRCTHHLPTHPPTHHLPTNPLQKYSSAAVEQYVQQQASRTTQQHRSAAQECSTGVQQYVR